MNVRARCTERPSGTAPAARSGHHHELREVRLLARQPVHHLEVDVDALPERDHGARPGHRGELDRVVRPHGPADDACVDALRRQRAGEDVRDAAAAASRGGDQDQDDRPACGAERDGPVPQGGEHPGVDREASRRLRAGRRPCAGRAPRATGSTRLVHQARRRGRSSSVSSRAHRATSPASAASTTAVGVVGAASCALVAGPATTSVASAIRADSAGATPSRVSRRMTSSRSTSVAE